MATTPQNVHVWLQTTARRNAEKTISSIERSDLGKRFTVCTDHKQREFPKDYVDLQAWWDETWRGMVEMARVRRCDWILRLEDDIVVNEHILHNVCSWPALNNPRFGLGTLFAPNYWHERPELFTECPNVDQVYRNIRDVEGGQAQLIRTDLVESLLDGVPQARKERGLFADTDQPSFDWSLSRTAWKLGLRAFVHLPALVDLTEASRHSKIDLAQHRGAPPQSPEEHYWGTRSFNKTWKRRQPLPVGLAPFDRAVDAPTSTAANLR